MAKATHDDLWKVCRTRPEDYDPWGDVKRWADPNVLYPDCSTGCRFFTELRGALGADWGVCSNPESHRSGLLTFEHQGCQKAAWGRKR